jgi:hypothetical protein
MRRDEQRTVGRIAAEAVTWTTPGSLSSELISRSDGDSSCPHAVATAHRRRITSNPRTSPS